MKDLTAADLDAAVKQIDRRFTARRWACTVVGQDDAKLTVSKQKAVRQGRRPSSMPRRRRGHREGARHRQVRRVHRRRHEPAASGIDATRWSDQVVRGAVVMPTAPARMKRVAVFARGAKADEAKAAGADIVGAEDPGRVKAGNINFDAWSSPPGHDAVVGRLGKILGPRGLMPNPKVGTVTRTSPAVTEGPQVEFRVDKAGIVHAGVQGRRLVHPKPKLRQPRAFVALVRRQTGAPKALSSMGPQERCTVLRPWDFGRHPIVGEGS